jgi:hypothetical protein
MWSGHSCPLPLILVSLHFALLSAAVDFGFDSLPNKIQKQPQGQRTRVSAPHMGHAKLSTAWTLILGPCFD